MFGKKSGEEIAFDKIPERIDRVVYIIERILNSYNYSSAASLLSYIAEGSKYKNEIPTTVDKIRKYIELTIEGVYRRVFENQKGIFGDIPDEVIKEKFYPLIKTYFEKTGDKLVVKSEEETGKAEMSPLLAELYGVEPDSKIILTTQDSPLSLEVSVKINNRLKPLSLGLNPKDAKILFGWDEIPDEFNNNKYRGKYSIGKVIKEKKEKKEKLIREIDELIER